MRVMEWPNLSEHGAQVKVITRFDAAGKEIGNWLAIYALPDASEDADRIDELAKACEVAKMMRHPRSKTPMWVSRGWKETLKRVPWEDLFPLVKEERRTLDQVEHRISPKTPGVAGDVAADISDAVAVEASQFQVVGRNHINQEVYEDAAGRYVKLDDGREIRESNRPAGMSPAIFLRAIGSQAMAACAEAFISQAIEGRKNLKPADLADFARRISAPGRLAMEGDRWLYDVEVAVRRALARRMARDIEGPDGAAYGHAERVHESIENAFSRWRGLSLPAAIAAQRLLISDIDPTSPNAAVMIAPDRVGAVVSALPRGFKVRTVGVEDDDVAVVSDVMSVRGVGREGIEGAPPLALTALPAVPLAEPMDEDGLTVSRSDHLAMLKSLSLRRADGRSVHLLAAGDAAQQALLEEISKRYEVEAIAEVDPAIFSGPPGQFGGQIVVVGRRRPTPRKEAELPEADEIAGHQELWDWTGVVLQRRARILEERGEAEAAQAADAAGRNNDLRNENKYQAVYVPASEIGQATTMVPRNLQAAHRMALARVIRRNGNVDDFVCRELGWTKEELAQRLAPEQVDAVAAAIDAWRRGRGFLEGDQTGLGKGRVLATLAVWCVRQNIKTVFMTEKEGLFTDFWRDIRAIGGEHIIRPWILNAGAKIYDPAEKGRVLHEAAEQDSIDDILAGGEFPKDANLVLMTYSQVNRPLEASAKAQWLRTAAEGCAVIGDEIHKAAGHGNTAVNVSAAYEVAHYRGYSSATWAKHPKNIHIYKWLFPPSVNVGDLPEILRRGGDPLLEAICANLCEDGVMVRREHDFSSLEIELLRDVRRLDRNRGIADIFAPILSSMARLSGAIDQFVGDIQAQARERLERAVARQIQPDVDGPGAMVEQAQRERQRELRVAQREVQRAASLSGVGINSVLYQLNRVKDLMIKVDLCIEAATMTLERHEKPLIYLDLTFESALNDAMKAITEDLGLPQDGRVRAGSFKQIMKKTLDRVCGVGRVRLGQRRTLDQVFRDQPAMREAYEQISAQIDAMPDFPISPIDLIKERVAQAGASIAEISGRSLFVNNGFIEKRQKAPTTELIRQFNAGETTALVMTSSGATGYSMHASAEFADQNRRCLIILDSPDTADGIMQLLGRVFRRGQTNAPRILLLSTGLPSEVRREVMLAKKLSQLAAIATSDRENSAVRGDDQSVPDLLSKIGNEVAWRIFSANPQKLTRLGATLPRSRDEQDRRMADFFYIEILTQRIALLPSREQEELWEELLQEFRAELSDAETAGISPLRTLEMKGTWRIVGRALFEGAPHTDLESVFDSPVYVSQLEGFREVRPMRSEEVLLHVENGSLSLGDVSVEEAAARLRRNMDFNLQLALPPGAGFATVEQALAAQGENSVKTKRDELTRIAEVGEFLRPGGSVVLRGAFDRRFHCLISAVRVPREGSEHVPAAWGVDLVFPGCEQPLSMTMRRLLQLIDGLPGDGIHDDQRADRILAEFDERFAGRERFRATVLEGNIWRATSTAILQGLGTSVIYNHEWVGRRRAVKLRDDRAHRIAYQPVRFYHPEAAAAWIANGGGGFANHKLKTSEGPSVYWQSKNKKAREDAIAAARAMGMIARGQRATAADGMRLTERDKLIFRLPSEKGNERFYMHPEVRALLTRLEVVLPNFALHGNIPAEAEGPEADPDAAAAAGEEAQGAAAADEAGDADEARADEGGGRRRRPRRKVAVEISPEILPLVCRLLAETGHSLYGPGQARQFANRWEAENVRRDPAAAEDTEHQRHEGAQEAMQLRSIEELLQRDDGQMSLLDALALGPAAERAPAAEVAEEAAPAEEDVQEYVEGIGNP